MPIFATLRALFGLAVAGLLAMFAAGDVTPPQIVTVETKAPEVRSLPKATADFEIEETSPPQERTPESTQAAPYFEEKEPETETTTVAPVVSIPLPQLSNTLIDTQTRGAVVHLLCTARSNRALRIITGSGIVVDPRGVVLTNAHVAQFWLLEGQSPLGTTKCQVRAQVPVEREFEAELLYLPGVWVAEHAVDIDNPNPRGTGEHDYALLRITDPISEGLSRPNVFPFVTYTTSDDNIEEKNTVILAAYPSVDDEASAKELRALDIASTVTTISSIFTFNSTTLDLFAVNGSKLSFKGSSGGAVVDEKNNLIGLITTSTAGDTPEERELRAITLAHIDRSLRAHSGLSFKTHTSGNLAAKAAIFNELIAPGLAAQLREEL